MLKSYQNLIITGACGTGKAWLARALGHNAARAEFTVLYQRLPRLFTDLAIARGDAATRACSVASAEPSC